ncbi:MAG: hypothetical protein KJO35_10205 [Gammaproteobacteria bacterium]|nr:hypothetical protein [Gammaproteobacteria bacterium]NNF67753.1 hypothetical protein [Gammaproteobacteria bacterium]
MKKMIVCLPGLDWTGGGIEQDAVIRRINADSGQTASMHATAAPDKAFSVFEQTKCTVITGSNTRHSYCKHVSGSPF